MAIVYFETRVTIRYRLLGNIRCLIHESNSKPNIHSDAKHDLRARMASSSKLELGRHVCETSSAFSSDTSPHLVRYFINALPPKEKTEIRSPKEL